MARSNPRALILFVWRRPPPPYFLGGAEITQALLASELRRAGYAVRYLGSFDEPWPGGVRIRDEVLRWLARADIESFPAGATDATEVNYRWEGVECRMCAGERLAGALSEELEREPQVVLASQEGSDDLLRAAAATDALTVGWIHSVTETGLLAAAAKPAELLSVSHFAQERVGRVFGRAGHLFYPPFRPVPDSEVGSRLGHLTFVNPIADKGGELLIEMARLRPDLSFVAVDGWYRAPLPSLPNLRRLHRATAMGEVWRGTSLLLVPSRVEEGFGRVCVEAGQRRVPSLTSGRGGLSEAAGAGGRIAEPDDVTGWIAEIQQMLEPGHYRSLGDAARRHATRFERDPVEELVALGVVPQGSADGVPPPAAPKPLRAKEETGGDRIGHE